MTVFDMPTAVAQVRRVLGRDDVSVERIESLWRPRLSSTRGVYRLDIDGADSDVPAIAVKVVERLPRGDGLPREAQLYASNVLPVTGDGLRAPRFFGLSEFPGGLVGIWVEYISSSETVPWPLTTFARVAGDLGRFSRSAVQAVRKAAGMVPARDLCGRPDLCEFSLALLDRHSRDPLARRAYPPAVARGLRELWTARAPIMSALARVPRQVCHGDAQCTNLFPQSPRGTIGIDWANLATGPAGIDAATLLHYALAYFHQDIGQADDLDRHIFDGYARGADLHDETTLRQARLAYAAQLALGIGLLEITPVLRLVTEPDRRRTAEEFYRRPLHDILDRRAQLAEFLLDLGQQARALATQLP